MLGRWKAVAGELRAWLCRQGIKLCVVQAGFLPLSFVIFRSPFATDATRDAGLGGLV